jgi:putative SOS response-associated peptidase YedK
VGGLVKQRYMLSVICGRSTYKLTWEEIVRLYRLTLDQPPVNTRARYNVCPTTTIDTIVANAGERRLVPMRWGLIPSWWSKPLKELRLATFNTPIKETVQIRKWFRLATMVAAARHKNRDLGLHTIQHSITRSRAAQLNKYLA